MTRAGTVKAEVAISECVHYCAFRYGHDEYHPYQTYIRRLHRGDPIEAIRREFIDFLLHFRPRHMGAALGVDLSRAYPLWAYPWSRPWTLLRTRRGAGWHPRARDVPDVITHFSDAGISTARIEMEYGWLHGAYDALTREGYRPDRYGCPRVQVLEGEQGRRAYLVLDGNHRISTLVALGHRSLEVEHDPRESLRIRDLDRWWGVRLRKYSREDARRVFGAYFAGNQRVRTPGATVPGIVD